MRSSVETAPEESSLIRRRSDREKFMYRGAYCAHTSPLPLLPSGPGGVGGIASRRARHNSRISFSAHAPLSAPRTASKTKSPPKSQGRFPYAVGYFRFCSQCPAAANFFVRWGTTDAESFLISSSALA